MESAKGEVSALASVAESLRPCGKRGFLSTGGASGFSATGGNPCAARLRALWTHLPPAGISHAGEDFHALV